MKKKYIIILIAAILIFAAGAAYYFIVDGSYQWISKDMQKQYAGVSWRDITAADSKNEAVSTVAATSSDLQMNANNIIEGRIATIENGYLVQVVKKNTFGCGNHEPTGVIYQVSKNGEIQEIAVESKIRFNFGPAKCVD